MNAIRTVLVLVATLCIGLWFLAPIPKELPENSLQRHVADFVRASRFRTMELVQRPVTAQLHFSGLSLIDEQELRASAGIQRKFFIWQPEFTDLEYRLKQHPLVANTQISCSYLPPSCDIAVEEAKPWLVAEFSGTNWLVSSTGRVVESLPSIRNPRLIYAAGNLARLSGLDDGTDPNSALGSSNTRFTFAISQLQFLEAAGRVPFSVERYRVLDEGQLELTPSDPLNHPMVRISAHTIEEAKTQLERLKQVLSDLSARGEQAKLVDLRFEDQAVIQ